MNSKKVVFTAHCPLPTAHCFSRWLIVIAAMVASAFSVSVRAQESAEQETIELVAVGDILLARGVAEQIERRGTDVVFGGVRGELSGADIAFGNLENPLARRCKKSPGRFSFQARPRHAEALTGAGLDVLSLANNHTLDCGRAGLSETLAQLTARGLRFVGAGETASAAEAPVIISVKGIKVAFVGFTDIAPSGASEKGAWGGVARASEAALRRAISVAAGRADVVVVSVHWGEEYASRPSVRQRELARAAVEAGADLVLGHHSHSLQGLAAFTHTGGRGTRRALVAYSLGNFVFDSPPALGHRVLESIILRCRFGKNGLVSAEVQPIVLEKYLPRRADPQEAQSILTRLTDLSAELGTGLSGGRVRWPDTLPGALN